MTSNEYEQWINSSNPKNIRKKSKVIIEINTVLRDHDDHNQDDMMLEEADAINYP